MFACCNLPQVSQRHRLRTASLHIFSMSAVKLREPLSCRNRRHLLFLVEEPQGSFPGVSTAALYTGLLSGHPSAVVVAGRRPLVQTCLHQSDRLLLESDKV